MLICLFRLQNVRSVPWCVCLSHPPASMLLLYHMQVVHGVASFIWCRCVACLGALAALCCACCERGCWVCAWAWPCCVPCLLACLCPCGLVLWGCALPCSLVCGHAVPALWAGLVRGPCLWASYKPLLYGPILRPCISSLIWASEKVLYFCLIFSSMYSCAFSGLCFRLKISGQIFRASKAGNFFRVLFSGFFPGLIFAAVSGFLFFLDVIFIRFPVLRDKFFHVVKFQELVHGGLVDSVALAF